jgi:hypothetical protein
LNFAQPVFRALENDCGLSPTLGRAVILPIAGKVIGLSVRDFRQRIGDGVKAMGVN